MPDTNWTLISGSTPQDYIDTAVFEVNPDTKQIALITGQALVAGEENSQYIKFVLDRYWDGIDIKDKAFYVEYALAGTYYGKTAAVNAEYNTEQVRFGWIVPKEACCISGTLLFVLRIESTDYVLKTQIAEHPVFKSVNVEDVVPEPTKEAWYREFQTRVDSAISEAETAVETAQATLTQVEASVGLAQTAAQEAQTAENNAEVAAASAQIRYGSPLTASEAALMVEENRVYVYTGSESGYTFGNWYYYDGSAWVSGGVYNGSGVNTDTTLTQSGMPADAKAVGDELSTIIAKVSAIEEAEGLHKYGVSGIGQSASALTRIWDSVGMTAQVGTDGDNSNVVNNFDDVTPFNRRKCVGHWETRNGGAHFVVEAYKGDEAYTEDGTKGDYVAVECPRAYYYLKDGVLGVSAHRYQGWRPFDIFCRNHDDEDTFEYAYLPAYALAVDANGHAVSLPNLDNAQGNYAQLLNVARTYKNGALGNLAIVQPAAVNFYEWAMFTVEFAQQDGQTIMQGCAGLRHSNDDHVTFVDSTHLLTNNYQAARVVGEYISVIGVTVDINTATYLATHKITEIMRCDAAGNASASGTHQLLTVEDLGRNYYEYDITGTTEYRLAARPYRTGACNGVSTPSGSPVSNSDSYHPMKYRHRENVYGNQFHTAVDLFNKKVGTGDDDYYLEHYYLPDPSAYTPANTNKPDATDLAMDAFVKLDIETPHSKYVSGYVKSRKYSNEYPDIWIPDETTGGSASTFYADYAALVNSDAVRSVRFGGAWSSGSAAGFSYFAGYAGPANGTAYFGGDLYFIQDNHARRTFGVTVKDGI